MSPLLWILWGLLLLITPLGLWRAKQLWRDETDELDRFDVTFRRTFAVRAAGVVVLLLALPAVAGGGEDDWPAWRIAWTVAVALGMVSITALYLSIRFTGRPQALIPPHLRDHAPGGRGGRRNRPRSAR